MFDTYDTFRLVRPIPGESIPVGSIGVVLMVFDGSEPTYEVEFVDDTGMNLGTSPTHAIKLESMEHVE